MPPAARGIDVGDLDPHPAGGHRAQPDADGPVSAGIHEGGAVGVVHEQGPGQRGSHAAAGAVETQGPAAAAQGGDLHRRQGPAGALDHGDDLPGCPATPTHHQVRGIAALEVGDLVGGGRRGRASHQGRIRGRGRGVGPHHRRGGIGRLRIGRSDAVSAGRARSGLASGGGRLASAAAGLPASTVRVRASVGAAGPSPASGVPSIGTAGPSGRGRTPGDPGEGASTRSTLCEGPQVVDRHPTISKTTGRMSSDGIRLEPNVIPPASLQSLPAIGHQKSDRAGNPR